MRYSIVVVTAGLNVLSRSRVLADRLAAEAKAQLHSMLGHDAGHEVAITLEKNLPVASGIGGGSADAAAVLRALGARVPRPEVLGADVPVCLAGVPCRMQGVGEKLSPLPPLPASHLVLVNPRAGLATPAVFQRLERRDNPPMPAALPEFPDSAALVDFLATCRNDLQAPAIALMPRIADCLAALGDAGALLTRMSGSGATCFGILPDGTAARAARDRIAAIARENGLPTINLVESGGADLPTTVMPFILRGVALLGIDSVLIGPELRRSVWARLESDLRPAHLDRLTTEIGVDDLDGALAEIQAGKTTGRTVVRISAHS